MSGREIHSPIAFVLSKFKQKHERTNTKRELARACNACKGRQAKVPLLNERQEWASKIHSPRRWFFIFFAKMQYQFSHENYQSSQEKKANNGKGQRRLLWRRISWRKKPCYPSRMSLIPSTCQQRQVISGLLNVAPSQCRPMGTSYKTTK